MKIRSLLLGSVAAAGLSTGAFAADLGVLTSMDICDDLGLSGLTISSDTNCLQITGEVKYKFTWGDYVDLDGDFFTVDTGAGVYDVIGGDGENDWESRFDAWVKVVATANSDFGPAKAVLKLKEVDRTAASADIAIQGGGSDTSGVILDEAYVSIGDSTVIMAGKKGSIMKKGDDEPLNWLGLFNSEKVDVGVSWGPFDGTGDDDGLDDGGHVIQVVSDLGNGFSIGAGLEDLNGANTLGSDLAGTAVGVISYSGEGISAHITAAAAGVLDGEIDAWGVHAGFTGTFDNFKVVLAGAYGHADDVFGVGNDYDYWNVLASASATFDIFTIAGSVEAVNGYGDTVPPFPSDDTDYGAGASISAAIADGVILNLGGRWYQQNIWHPGIDNNAYQVAASVSAAVTESITVTGEIGYLNDEVEPEDVFYGSGKLAWAPGANSGFTSSIKGTVSSGIESGDVGYKLETEFKKTFE
ncbi:hypothetical protein PRN20_10295 [Devosia sp. ZB163]|uniref:hypothetical protein n=1 Tax=Devosia sp. ZB163 TaxID=3025938 RepID=UPI00235F6769|nr:hypothetical protein [Devosia sp. ZB163]MDC9824128.1 hypothetical protein [Devosia sp. ZB163]